MAESEAAEHLPASADVETGGSRGHKPRVAALVGLVLLEVIRNRDLPAEVLSSEDPTRTMPRRLGLSEAVELQIRRFRDQVRKKGRIGDEEVKDLAGLVLRRPDADEVFFQAGELLAGKDSGRGGISRAYPRKVRLALARRRTRRRLSALFGRSIGAFAKGEFILEARGHFLLELDPGGDACALVTGLAQSILCRYFPEEVRVSHTSCQGLKHDLCRWSLMG